MAISLLAASHPNRTFGVAATAARTAAGEALTTDAAATSAIALAMDAADAAAFRTDAASATAIAAALAATDAPAIYDEVKYDAWQLHERKKTSEQLATSCLWPLAGPSLIEEAWLDMTQLLRGLGSHWSVWIDWYEDLLADLPRSYTREGFDEAFTDIPGALPWSNGAEAVNTEIARRLNELSSDKDASKIPDQSPAPVRVEERSGKVAKASDRDSALGASELDFMAWRDPVVEHIEELIVSDFAAGTNHSRVRDRLIALGKLLPGEIAEVKDRQFRIGYEIERFEGLIAAYRSGGEDMPALNAAQLEDLERLRVALKMGISKLERWLEFYRQANESAAGEAAVDREAVSDALDEMANAMEQRLHYFDPELPATFRFLAEAVRDPAGATKTIVYGAIKSAENVVSFLGQRALGIGMKGVDAVETHISKAVATLLVASLSGAALELSGALPQGWAWLKPLLAGLGIGG